MTRSSDDIAAYPLTWPVGRPRARVRHAAMFRSGGTGITSRRLSVADALDRLLPELDRLGARHVIVSTNVRTRADGLPYSNQEPADPGVAVYFRLGEGAGVPHCLACDRWTRVADNLAAIAAHVAAIRGMQRWGVGDVLQALAGHRALPAAGPRREWWQVLGVGANERPETIRRRYHELMQQHHPDRGGNANQAAEVTAAYQEAVSAGRAL